MHLAHIARLVACVALTGGALAGVATTPAHAASSPTCNGTRTVNYGGFYANMPTFDGSVTCTMYQVVKGPEVSALQRHLNNCYGENLAVDGSYGPLTWAAVRRAQTQEGVADKDGDYGPYTRQRMRFYGYTIVNGNARWSCRRVG